MKQILELMNKRKLLLKQAIRRAEKEEGTFPKGRLRISMNRGCPRYYYVTESNNPSGDYISKTDIQLARSLAQKDYNEEFLENARKELLRLEKSIKHFSKENADLTYDKLSDSRKNLISPYILNDDNYAEAWLAKPYRANPFKPEKKIHDTDRGEKVRSKSEALIANMLYSLGIPYRYEEEIRMANGNVRYPDFTLLKKITREVVYLEHLGLSDLEEYRVDNLRKLEEYQTSGIYLGKNLIITYEIEGMPLNLKGIRKMLMEVLEIG